MRQEEIGSKIVEIYTISLSVSVSVSLSPDVPIHADGRLRSEYHLGFS